MVYVDNTAISECANNVHHVTYTSATTYVFLQDLAYTRGGSIQGTSPYHVYNWPCFCYHVTYCHWVACCMITCWSTSFQERFRFFMF